MCSLTFLRFLPAFSLLILLPVACLADTANVIFDTDLGGDVDDAGALGILNKLTNLGEARMLACMADVGVKGKSVGGCIKAINSYYGNGDVPIGTYHGTKYTAQWNVYDDQIRDEFAKDEPPDDRLPPALQVYRRTLNAASDGSVTIVSVGFMVNLRELLESPADGDSLLPGLDLVKRKVKKLVVMGGYYPSGKEWNFSGDGVGPTTAMVLEKWPTPILFSGAPIGQGITTGIQIKSAPLTDPVRRAYELYNKFAGRQSWDLTAVLAAVRDPKLYWDVVEDGSNRSDQDGNNVWTPTPHRGHSYLLTKMPPAEVGKVLDELMTAPPGPAK